MQIQPVGRAGPAINRTSGADENDPRAIGQHHIGQRPREGLFVHMRVHQFAQCKAVACFVRDLPSVGVVVPSGVVVTEGDAIFQPMLSRVALAFITFGASARAGAARVISKAAVRICMVKCLARVDDPITSRLCVGCYKWPIPSSSRHRAARECDANSRRSRTSTVNTVIAIKT